MIKTLSVWMNKGRWKKPLRRAGLLWVLFLLLSFGAAAAQGSFNLNWFTVDGGGGPSQGGAYAVYGALGQPDAGWLAGGTYTLASGFLEGRTTSSPMGSGSRIYLPAIHR